jgi:uncharacterized RDD family membrane protein YckC
MTDPNGASPVESERLPEVAGLGSRMLAALFDAGLLLGVWLLDVMLVLFLAARARSAASTVVRNVLARQWPFRAVNGGGFALLVGSLVAATCVSYFVAEMLGGGQSPGKRAVGLRVVRRSGQAAGVVEIAVRNALRAVDWLPFAYALGLVASVASRTTQRLGDIVAGTVVVRERPRRAPLIEHAPGRLGSLLAPEEMAILAEFWARAPMMLPAARTRLASQIAPLMRARLADARPLDAENFLWDLLRDGEATRPESL